ncbi:kin of IRRE-like protein 2 [Ptychodera flava]|uniref:kin of IRRE-like protein 2 n=1 Tax=Ptychodera flava TaxID=63121 RepID=UPI00396A7E5E
MNWYGFTLYMLYVLPCVLGGQLSWNVIPPDVCARLDSRVTLPCGIHGQQANPSWLQIEPTRRLVSHGFEVDYKACGTCSITGDQTQGQHDLTIDPVSDRDIGTWRCEQFGAHPAYHDAKILSTEPCTGASMSVVSGATHKSGRIFEAEAGSDVTFFCTPLGCQESCTSVMFYKDGVVIPHSGDGRLTVQFRVPNEEHSRHIISCRVQNDIMSSYREENITVTVGYDDDITKPTPVHEDTEQVTDDGDIVNDRDPQQVTSQATSVFSSWMLLLLLVARLLP